MKTKIALFVVFTFLAVTQNIAQTPTLQTRKATNVDARSANNNGSFNATLNGIVNADNTNCEVYFEYGETESYGFTIAATPGTVTGSTDVAITADISIPNDQLIVRTKINFRIKVINENGTYYSRNFIATVLVQRKMDFCLI